MLLKLCSIELLKLYSIVSFIFTKYIFKEHKTFNANFCRTGVAHLSAGKKSLEEFCFHSFQVLLPLKFYYHGRNLINSRRIRLPRTCSCWEFPQRRHMLENGCTWDQLRLKSFKVDWESSKDFPTFCTSRLTEPFIWINVDLADRLSDAECICVGVNAFSVVCVVLRQTMNLWLGLVAQLCNNFTLIVRKTYL